MDNLNPDLNAVVRGLTDMAYGHLERRTCTPESPMPKALEHRYRWSHPTAVEVEPFFNLMMCRCDACGLTFTAPPK